MLTVLSMSVVALAAFNGIASARYAKKHGLV